jgi:hypothetical protein
MTYAEARSIYTLSLEAGQDRRSLLNDLRKAGLTDTQLWAVVNQDPKWF